MLSRGACTDGKGNNAYLVSEGHALLIIKWLGRMLAHILILNQYNCYLGMNNQMPLMKDIIEIKTASAAERDPEDQGVI